MRHARVRPRRLRFLGLLLLLRLAVRLLLLTVCLLLLLQTTVRLLLLLTIRLLWLAVALLLWLAVRLLLLVLLLRLLPISLLRILLLVCAWGLVLLLPIIGLRLLQGWLMLVMVVLLQRLLIFLRLLLLPSFQHQRRADRLLLLRWQLSLVLRLWLRVGGSIVARALRTLVAVFVTWLLAAEACTGQKVLRAPSLPTGLEGLLQMLLRRAPAELLLRIALRLRSRVVV